MIRLQYRLAPHVTLSGNDSFEKTSNIFNQPDLTNVTPVSGEIQQANFSAFAPVADLLWNSGNVGISYQFGLNGMIGASGSFSTINFPTPAEVPGLYDSSSQGGSAYYSLRLTPENYLGVTYQYQRIVSSPPGGVDEAQTHAVYAVLFVAALFETLCADASEILSLVLWRATIRRYHYTSNSAVADSLSGRKVLEPCSRGSFGWQEKLTRAAFSYTHGVSSGGGLIGAVHLDSAALSFERQIRKTISASVAGMYARNNVLGSLLGAYGGHTISGSATVQKQFDQNIGVQLSYAHLHQDYGDVQAISSTPNTNRESISISYRFSRPVGR